MARGVKSRKKPGVGAGEAAALLNAISQDRLDEQEILPILEVETTPCDHTKNPCRANRKDNVACFCQLAPAETSFRKKGLWQKEQAYLGTLGNDPVEQKREDASHPSGLRNLGNTCYANAALQCLFSIPSLRNGIYGAEPQVASHDIFRQLQSLFLQMQFGPRSSVDTETLAKTLGLNHAIQQDGQEFLKLLLTRVEQMLGKSGDQAARRLVQRLFRGGLSYVTTCQRCGRDSASSRDVQDFYDLMPQVRGFESLTESLASILHAESLTGDNQYRCEFCSEKVDALRHVRLRSLPPYLCLALQRFYFDPRTADKAKALDKFSFPLQLDFRQVLDTAAAAAAAEHGMAAPVEASGSAGSCAAAAAGRGAGAAPAAAALKAAQEVPEYATGSPLYELVAILIHKGSQASSGHYVAHIKDQTWGQWWRFDDEVAECIGPDPTAKFLSDHGTTAAAAAAAAAAGADAGKGAGGASRKRAAGGDSGGDPDYELEQEAGEQAEDNDEEGEEVVAGKGAKAAARGKKRGGSTARGRGRPAKKAGGRARGRPPAAAGNDSDGNDAELARAKAASRQQAPPQAGACGRRARTRGRATAAVDEEDGGDEEEDLRRALAASMTGQQQANGREDEGGREGDDDLHRALAASMAHQRQEAKHDAVLAAVLEESARAQSEEAVERKDAGVEGRAEEHIEHEEAGPGSMSGGKEVEAGKASGEATAPQPPAGSGASAAKVESDGAAVSMAAPLAGERFGATWHVGPAKGTAPPPSQPQQPGDVSQVVSTNAYMLVYRAVGFDEPPAVAEAGALPEELQEAVSADAAAFMEQCDIYQRQRQALKDQMEARRRAVRDVLSYIALGSDAPKARLQEGQELQPVLQQPTQEHQEVSQQQEVGPAQSLQEQSPSQQGHGHGESQQRQEQGQELSQQRQEQGQELSQQRQEQGQELSQPQEEPLQQPARSTASPGPTGAAARAGPESNGDGPACGEGRASANGGDVAMGEDEGGDGAAGNGYWVSTAWLEQWANDEGSPPPIDNGPIMCSRHCSAANVVCGRGRCGDASGAGNGNGGGDGGDASGDRNGAMLDPSKVTAAKLVSRAAWRTLKAAHGGGSTLATGDVCRECLASKFSAKLLGNQADQVRARVAALLERADAASPDGGDEDRAGLAEDEEQPGPSGSGRGFWVSRPWLQGWSRRQGASVKAEKSPTADVVCPHGQLLASAHVKTARHVAVPADIWYFLRDLWRQQRLREAEEEARSAAAAAAAGGAGGAASARPSRRGRPPRNATNVPPVDCFDLTGEMSPQTKPPAAAPGAATTTADDDDVVEVVIKLEAGRGALKAEDDGDVVEVVERAPGDAAASGGATQPQSQPAAAVSVPTPAELDALCPALPVGRVRECPACRAAAGQAAEAQAGTKRQVDAERAALGGLAPDVLPTVEPGGRYYLVPSTWVQEWQQYVRPPARRGTTTAPGCAGGSAAAGSAAGAASAAGAGSSAGGSAAGGRRPGSLCEAMMRVLCPCHPEEPRLGVPLPRLVVKRNKLCQQACEQDALRIVQPEDWQQLRRLYDIPAGTTDPASAAPSAPVTRRTRGAGRRGAAAANNSGRQRAEDEAGDMDVVICDEERRPNGPLEGGGAGPPASTGRTQALNAASKGFAAEVVLSTPPASAAGAEGGSGDERPAAPRDRDRGSRDQVWSAELRVWPPVCPEALAAHTRAAKEALLSYKEAQVMVELVQQEELEGAFREGVNAERKSKRSRKNRTALVVSNTATLEQLKLQVYQNLSVHPRNQALYVLGEDGQPRQLEGDDLSLAQHEVAPEQEIRLVHLNMVDDDDDVVDLLGGGPSKKRQVEEGFKNTALHGDLPPHQQGPGCTQDLEPMQEDGPADESDGEPSEEI